MNKEKALKRLRKLKAMIDDGSNQNEVETALRQYQSILAKYNLDESDLSEEERDPIIDSFMDQRNISWRRIVANSIAKLYFCKFYYGGNIKNNICRFHYIGTEINIEFAKDITNYVIDFIINSCERILSGKGDFENKQKFRESFRQGAARKIQYRCWELIEDPGDGLASDDLPCLIDAYKSASSQIEEYLKKVGLNLYETKIKNNYYDPYAYEAGSSEADSVSLRKSVKTNQLLLENK